VKLPPKLRRQLSKHPKLRKALDELLAEVPEPGEYVELAPMFVDEKPTAVEQVIARDAARWHIDCEKHGALYVQSLEQTVLTALVRARVSVLSLILSDIQARLAHIETCLAGGVST